ncbi:HNH endonuclease signature motif containing protein [Aspergillus thermomutatus]|uniref:HNH nuclease domain-containing protein n=1 Tax=Aspergillus thermomutatus TaxID=41047 RepID=A0A397HHP3_ASPTH|nr:uncharacterized protein CDV56_106722 [Aspergillus thermomutatus]RHZ60000.1 hypothetical protein CDV56_106722 [Aspergillus thermomutatus]
MWELLYRCFPNVDKVAKMKVENINDLSNGITLLSSIHEEFGKFTIAFRPTDRQNVYELQMFRRCPPYLRGSLPPDKIVEFKQAPGAEHLKLPSSDLLECHWRLAEILNASGMAEIIDGYRREWEDIKTGAGSSLREDGKTDVGKMLSVAFWQHVAG